MLCAATLAVSITACGSNSDDSSDSTLTGKVTAIDGTAVTLQLGQLTEDSNGGAPQQGGEMPDNGSGTPPEMPAGENNGDNGSGTPPEMPENGNAGDSGSGTPPEMPEGVNTDGNSSSGQPQGGEMPGGMSVFTEGDETATVDLADAEITKELMGGTEEGSTDDITEGDILVIELGDDDSAQTVTIKNVGGGGNGFGGSGEVTQGSSANTIEEDGEYADETYASEGDDENALRVDGAEATLTNITVDKSAGSSSNTEDGDFYGMNAALLATDGANVTIKDATVTSSAQNGNGVFSYGENTVVNISDSKITTSADNSGGIQTTGGGTTNASDLTVETSGNSSAAIRSDRGGGTVDVDGGTYTSKGYNSPAVYSTADITVKNAELTAENSEALVVEGKNSIALEDCEVSGNMSDTEGTSSDENVHNVMIYQSMSGDADVGTANFSMTGGKLTGNNGDLFYITNTHCILNLSDVDLVNKDSDGYLMLVSGNSASRGWGTAGQNGAQVEFTADGQVLEGDIAVDTISALDMTLSNGSAFTGTINIIDNEQGGTAVDDNAAVTIEEGSTWTLTGNCTVTSLENNGTLEYNGYTITLADGTVLSE